MQTFSDRFTNTALLSVEHVEAPQIVTSDWIDEQLAPLYEHAGVRPGLLESVAGVKERRWWPEGQLFSTSAAAAGKAALAAAGIDPQQVGLLIDTSVCRDHLEPSAASAVHHQLQLSSACINFDLSNACLGFVSAMTLAAAMIDAGRIDYALIVDAEGSRQIQQATIARLLKSDSAAGDMFEQFASLTLGSGAVAAVLGRADTHPGGHRIAAAESGAATQHHRLCIGSIDQMRTDTAALMVAGIEAATQTFEAALARGLGWAESDHYIIHQVSLPHTKLLCEKTGIDESKVPLAFPLLGNIGPASIPTTLSMHKENISEGQRVLLGGIGSGVNVTACEMIW